MHVLCSIAFVWVAAPRALWPQTGPDGLVCRAIRQTSQADTTSWLCRGPELATRRPRRNTIEHCLGCCFVKVEKIGEKCSSCGDRWAKLQPDLELKTCTQCGKMCWRPNKYALRISCFSEHVLSPVSVQKAERARQTMRLGSGSRSHSLVSQASVG